MRFAREGYPFMVGAVFLAALAWVAVAAAGTLDDRARESADCAGGLRLLFLP